MTVDQLLALDVSTAQFTQGLYTNNAMKLTVLLGVPGDRRNGHGGEIRRGHLARRSDVRTWTSVPLQPPTFDATGLSLQHGGVYYISVRAKSKFRFVEQHRRYRRDPVDLEKRSSRTCPPDVKVEDDGYVLKWMAAQSTIPG